MTKETFNVEVNPNTAAKFVKKSKDELVKNRRSKEKGNFGGFMTENKESPQCPVKSFEKLLSKLHPANNRLWQRPRYTFCENDSVWYTKQGIGKDSTQIIRFGQPVRHLYLKANLLIHKSWP